MRIDQLGQYVPHVFRFAVYLVRDHHMAQDVAQDTLLRAWKHRQRLSSLDCPRTWLLRIAVNVAKDYQRKRGRMASKTKPLPEELAGDLPEPWFGMVQQEHCADLRDVILKLTERERGVLYLSAFENLSHGQIAEVLSLSPGAVKVALSRARKSLRQRLRQEGRQSR